MLVFSRKPNESFVIGKNAKISVKVAIKPNQVRLGITAPESVVVHREEVHQRIQNKPIKPPFKKSNSSK